MAYKKTNEAWFGDSFNRDANLCSYTVTSDDLQSIIGSVDASITPNDYMAYGVADKISATSSNLSCKETVTANDYAIASVTDSLSTELKKIQAQIDDLKQNYVPKKGADKLRSALATLRYNREV